MQQGAAKLPGMQLMLLGVLTKVLPKLPTEVGVILRRLLLWEVMEHHPLEEHRIMAPEHQEVMMPMELVRVAMEVVVGVEEVMEVTVEVEVAMEAVEEEAMGEETAMEDKEVGEAEVVTEGTRFSPITKSLYKDYPQIQLKKILPSFLVRLVSSRLTRKQENKEFSFTLTKILACQREKPLLHMMTQMLLNQPFSGSMEKI